MLTEQRKRHILDLVARDGQVVGAALSRELGVSEDTIRRDLRDLAQEGLVQRVHGGALRSSPAVADYAGRQGLNAAAKAAIGQVAAGLVRPSQVVILDGGTTAAQVARHLPPGLEATVVTHSPSTALELVHHPRLAVILLGGRLFRHSVVAVGAATVEAAGRVNADLFFLGVTGVHAQSGLTTGDAEEAEIKRVLSGRAAETFVLASSEKLGTASPFVVAPLAAVAGLITERETPDALLAPLAATGLEIIRA